MIPSLQKVVLNGASRHRLNKGFILTADSRQPLNDSTRDRIVSACNKALSQEGLLAGFVVEARSTHPSLIGLITPFLAVYDVRQREIFINSLALATTFLKRAAASEGCRLMPAGVNPLSDESDSQSIALCSDQHYIEVLDLGEVELIHNLFRQFLPELLAISAHASIYCGRIQKDFSYRMRVNPSSFLPRYLSQVSFDHIAKLERIMRKKYGLPNLSQMDVNPLSGNAELLGGADLSPAGDGPAVELRFIDAQCSYAFIRAQIILFQAIAIYGRSLARRGRRLPFMRDEIIDENKALAIEGGAVAILKPDLEFKRLDRNRSFLFHDKKKPERATTSLLMITEGRLIPALQDMDCQYQEIAPIVLGAELRRRGKRCLVNYAEYQNYLYYANKEQFASALQRRFEELLSSPENDFVSQYNQSEFYELAVEIKSEWERKLALRPRHTGQVQWFDPQKGYGVIAHEQGNEISVEQDDIEGVEYLRPGDPVTYEVGQQRGGSFALRVRLESRQFYTGRVMRLEPDRDFGFIDSEAQGQVYVRFSDVLDGRKLSLGDEVVFELSQQAGKKPRALRVRVKEQRLAQGVVKWFNPQKRFGYITQADGKDIFVHQDDLNGVPTLKPKQAVSFQLSQTARGIKAVNVRVCAEE